MRKKLTDALGTVGFILFYLLGIAVFGMPMWELGFPIWVSILLFIAITNIPFIGDIIGLGIWIWSFINEIQKPFDIFVIIYYVVLVVYVITMLIPFVQGIISALRDR